MPPPPLSLSVSDEEAVQSFIRESVPDHVSRLHSVRTVPGYPLRVGIALDLEEISRPATADARLVIAIGIIATLMLVTLMALPIVEIRRRADLEIKLSDERARLAGEIDQERQIQEQLRSSEARLRDFAEMASDWFWEMDADLCFVETSVVGPPLPGGDGSHFGKHPWDAFDTSLAPEKWADLRRCLLARKPFRDFRHAWPDVSGQTRHVSINGVPVFGDAGDFLGYRGTGRDVTAKVEAEEELRRSKDHAEASNTARSAFLANMSHELRTPLNAIIGFAELIHSRKTGRITDDYVQWAGDILSSGRHLLDLINDVLELSRIEAGRYELADDRVDLGLVARACLPMVRRQAEKNRVRIEFAIAERVAVVRADRRAIKQIVLNLLTNAVKFTPRGGAVMIRVEPEATGEISLAVADTGIGIDPAVLPRLCKPFVQADASTSRRYGGTGLGLAISAQLVTLHGGTLTIESTLGEGTTVRVNFPADRVLSTRKHAEAAV
jgi:PAS domain S-box-containing protein